MDNDDILTVSVCVPTVNRLEMLEDALGSLNSQSYTNFELVLSDNSGSDAYNLSVSSLVKTFNFKDVQIFHQPKTLDLISNTNFLVDQAKGDLWIYLPDDDILQPDCLSRFVKEFTLKPNLDLAFSDHWMMDSQCNLCERDSCANSNLYGRNTIREGVIPENDLFRLALTQAFELQSMMFRTSLIKALRFDARYPVFPDYVLQLALALHRPKPSVSYIPQRLTAYRVHGGQDRYKLDTVTTLNQILGFLNSIDATNTTDRALLRKKISQLQIEIGKHQLIQGRRKDASKSFQSARLANLLNTKLWILCILSRMPQPLINRVFGKKQR